MGNSSILGKLRLFPDRRFESNFPMVFWLAGLWFYLKSFLYFCYLYTIGLEPTPYPPLAKFEIIYFSLALVPAFWLGFAFWNEKAMSSLMGVIYLIIDTPILGFHVLRMADEGYLDSGLTQFLEVGSLAMNVIVLGWLIGSRSASKTSAAGSGKRK